MKNSRNYSVPIFYLAHTNEVLDPIFFKDDAIKSEDEKYQKICLAASYTERFVDKDDLIKKWSEYSKIAKKKGIFVPIFSESPDDLIRKSNYAKFYEELLEKDLNVFPVLDSFFRNETNYSPINNSLKLIEAAILGNELGSFSESKHIITGAFTHDCIKGLIEMLVYGLGLGKDGIGRIASISPSVPLENIVVPQWHVYPAYHEVKIEKEIGYRKFSTEIIKTDPRPISDIVKAMRQ